MIITKTICLFGDSLSKGIICDPDTGRYIFLKDCFASLVAADGKLGVSNYSKFGCTIGKARGIIEKHISDAERADVTALEFGGNDSDYDWAAISAEPDAEHSCRTPLDVFTESYTDTVLSLRKQGVRLVLSNLPPIDPQRYFDWFSRGLNKGNLLRWLGGSVDYIYRWHESYSMCISRIAASCGVPLLDIRSPFLLRRDYSDLLCIDGIHPNAKGHALISSVIEKSLPSLSEQLFPSGA